MTKLLILFTALLGLAMGQAPLKITTTSIPAATAGQPYSTTLQVTGGVPPYLWFFYRDAYPPGLGAKCDTGEINGVPTVPGTYPLTFVVLDASGSWPAQEGLITGAASAQVVLTLVVQ